MAPHFYNGNVEGIRDAGSDTTFFMMQRIGDLYTGAGLYGCTLNYERRSDPLQLERPCLGTTNLRLLLPVGTEPVHHRRQRQLGPHGSDRGCRHRRIGWRSEPALPGYVHPASRRLLPLVEAGGHGLLDHGADRLRQGRRADHRLPGQPERRTGRRPRRRTRTINGGVVGPVALGWLPGDPNSGPTRGRLRPLTNGRLSNVDNGGEPAARPTGSGAPRTPPGSPTGARSTNLGPNLEVQGVTLTNGSTSATDLGHLPVDGGLRAGHHRVRHPVGHDDPSRLGRDAHAVPGRSSTATDTVRITTTQLKLAVGSGACRSAYRSAHGRQHEPRAPRPPAPATPTRGASSGGCSSNMNTNAAHRPQPGHRHGDNATAHIALENNSDQIDQFANGDFPSPDFVDQAIEASTDAVHRVQRCVQHQPVRRGRRPSTAPRTPGSR